MTAMITRARSHLPSIARIAFLTCAVALAACADGNSAPSLALVLDQQVVIGETLRLVMTGDDPDGDRVTFKVEGLPKTAQVTPRSKSEAVIVWSPLITDTQPGGRRYDVAVEANDGRGGTAKQTFGIVVYPTFGTPTFNLPAGVVLNLAEEDDLALLVEVKDDDSTDVTIEMTEGPAGAKLQRAEAKASYFYWKPDDLQRETAVHRAIFQASDESHAPTTHVLTLVLLNAEKQSGCEGTPPNVAFAPLSDQNLSGPLVLTATATDAQSQVESLVLHWTRGDPSGTFTAASFLREQPNGNEWTVTAEVGAPGAEGSLVHYYLTATDNDDPTGITCDRSGRYPKTGYFTAGIYPPGTANTTCIDDDAEPDGDTSAAPIFKAGTYPGRRICGDDLDFVNIDATAGKTVVAAVTWSPRDGELDARLVDQGGTTLANAQSAGEGRLTVARELPADGGDPLFLQVSAVGIGTRASYTVDLAIEDTRCPEDDAEPDSSPESAKPMALGAKVEQKLCPGDSDFFVVPASGPFTATLTFDHRYGDLDLELRGGDGVTVLASSTSENSVETIDFTPTGGGNLYVRVFGIPGAGNAYTLELTQGAGATCTGDGLGDTTTPATAATLFQDVYDGFVTCADKPDWFTFEVNGGEAIDILTLSEGATLNLSLYQDPAGAPVATATTDNSGFTEIQWTAPTPGRLYYKVLPSGADTATYSLYQQITDPLGPCADDRLEPNSDTQPSPIEPGVHTWLRLCSMSDVDAFVVEVEAFRTLTVLTAHQSGSQYTDIEVFGPAGNSLFTATDFGQGAYLEEVAEAAGKYVIVVQPFDVTTGLGYDLAVYLD